jgi:hypothetical protein
MYEVDHSQVNTGFCSNSEEILYPVKYLLYKTVLRGHVLRLYPGGKEIAAIPNGLKPEWLDGLSNELNHFRIRSYLSRFFIYL